MRSTRFTRIGTAGLTDEEAIHRIAVVNTISIAVSLSILVIGPTLIYYFHCKPTILIPLALELIINSSVLWLNHRRQYLAASLTLYYLQCVAITYFSFCLVQLTHLEFVVVLLIAIIYLVFKASYLRKIALAAALAVLAILEISYYLHGSQPSLAYMINLLVVLAIISITILVCRPYVEIADKRYELQRANDLIKIFTAQVTHELRSSIDSIYQVTQLLRREAHTDESMVHIQPLLDISFLAGTDARNIIDNVLNMAEIESGRPQAIVSQPLHPKPFFSKALEIHRVIAQEANIQLQLQIDMPETIISDPLNLKQILNNLVANAIKYANKGSIVNVDIFEYGDQWQLKVSNLGQGISQDMINSIFDPFVRIQNTRTGMVQGTGLGLYIVRSKVMAMAGRIDVQSRPGGYTSFTVTLPLVQGKARNTNAQDEARFAEELFNLAGTHILIAEDRELTAFLLCKSLKSAGCEITLVANGLELLQTVQKALPQNLPDMIILDSHMPILGGEETIRQLKKDPLLSNIPIIVITGDIFSGTLDKMLEAGADTFLKKPIDHVALRQTIGMYLARRHTQ